MGSSFWGMVLGSDSGEWSRGRTAGQETVVKSPRWGSGLSSTRLFQNPGCSKNFSAGSGALAPGRSDVGDAELLRHDTPPFRPGPLIDGPSLATRR